MQTSTHCIRDFKWLLCQLEQSACLLSFGNSCLAALCVVTGATSVVRASTQATTFKPGFSNIKSSKTKSPCRRFILTCLVRFCTTRPLQLLHSPAAWLVFNLLHSSTPWCRTMYLPAVLPVAQACYTRTICSPGWCDGSPWTALLAPSAGVKWLWDGPSMRCKWPPSVLFQTICPSYLTYCCPLKRFFQE